MSTAPIRALVAVDRRIEPRTVESVLDDPGINVVGVVDQDGGIPAPDARAADVLIVACGGASEQAVAYVSSAVNERPEHPVVVVCGGRPNGFVRDVLSSGADDIVLIEDSATPGADTFFALQKALARRSGAFAAASHGELVCVLGPKGGIGKTLTSSNLGVALSEAGHRTVVVDLDLQFGDLGLALGLEPEHTVYDLATSGGVLDVDKVGAYLVEHRSGLQVLLAPVRPDQAASITVDFLKELYATLKASFDFVVVDTPPGFSPEVIATIDASSSICMVGMLDAPSLKNTRLGLQTLDLMGYPRERVRVMLNRADTSVGITHADVVAVLGRAPDVLVPSQRDVVRSINAGEPIVLASRRSEPAKAFQALAELLASAGAGAQDNGGRSRRL
ncbi:MAG TPA: AAA family ATPase, partial [Solirubrobacteraceae bacterium]|nr:AAA family ATPase [Solirubrobacteraceae bacterium]